MHTPKEEFDEKIDPLGFRIISDASLPKPTESIIATTTTTTATTNTVIKDMEDDDVCEIMEVPTVTRKRGREK